MKKRTFINLIQFFLVFSVGLFNFFSAQTASTALYHTTLQGGVTMASNAFTDASYKLSNAIVTPPHWVNIVNSPYVPIAGTANDYGEARMSSSADLILPSGSTVVKAYLMLETSVRLGDTSEIFTRCYLKAGSAAWQQLAKTTNVASDTDDEYHQSWWDITSIVQAAGATTYIVADPTPHSGASGAPNYYGGGWTIMVVYSNPNSKFRDITIARNAQKFSGSSLSVYTDVANVAVPSSGTVKAQVGVTGTYGDRNTSSYDFTDYADFGPVSASNVYTPHVLTNPSLNVTNDILGSTIGFDASNNVSADGGTAVNGNYTARNPNSTETGLYDASIMDASGFLPASATPIKVRFRQTSGGGDVLYSGFYFVSVDISGAKLSKSLDVNTIQSGGTTYYTFTVSNPDPAGYLQSGLSFTDTLPTGLQAITPQTVTPTGTAGTVLGTVTVTSSTVSLSGASVPLGGSITFKVAITNKTGNLNADCSSNPTGFTNSTSNIYPNVSSNLGVSFSPQCLLVTPFTGCSEVSTATGVAKTAKVGISTFSTPPNLGWPQNVNGVQLAIDSTKPLFITALDPASVTNPTMGMFIYDTVSKCFSFYNGTAWKCLKKCGL